MNVLNRRFFILIIGVVLSFAAHAQMVTEDVATGPLTAEDLITEIFLGEGVEVTSVSFDGDDIAVGTFEMGLAAIGMDSGIVMTTGRCMTEGAMSGAEEEGAEFASSILSDIGMDPDISDVVDPFEARDVQVFTLTFIPTSDSIRFNYVWASEEYPEYACSNFNDAFGFFLSGPGIVGPYEDNGINIALIPGTTLPVTINNVNIGMVGDFGQDINCEPPNGSLDYSQYYVDNDGSNNQPVYDGFTTVLTALAEVIPCEEYKIKLVIADSGDQSFDSGVFLEANSFSANAISAEARGIGLDGSISEGCLGGELEFILSEPADEDIVVNYTIGGTAINGVDYEMIPDNITILEGETVLSFPVDAIEDGLDEGTETIIISIELTPCRIDSFFIFIRDNELVAPDLTDTLYCTGTDPIILDGTVPIFIPDPQMFTNVNDVIINQPNTEIISDINVSNVILEEVGPGVIQSVCINIQHGNDEDLDIFLRAPDGSTLELSTDNGGSGDNYTNTCFTENALSNISDLANTPPYTGNFQPEGNWSTLYGAPTNGIWELVVIDDAGNLVGTILDWTLTFTPLYQVNYFWSPTDDLSCAFCPQPEATPSESRWYKISYLDTYGCTLTDSVFIEVDSELPAPTITCDEFDLGIAFDWDDIDGAMAYQVVLSNGDIDTISESELELLNLAADSTVTIEVTAIGRCGGIPASLTCTTPPCSPPDMSVVDLLHESCFLAEDGSFTILAIGGSSYEFTLMPGMIMNGTGSFNNLPPDDYTIIVTDTENANCTRMIEVTVDPAPEMVVNIFTLSEIECAGDSNGVMTATIDFGAAPFTFDWGGISSDSIATDLPPGMFTLTVVDADGCEITAPFSLQEPPALSFSIETDNVLCFGGSNGQISLFAAGNGPFDYSIDGGQTFVTNSQFGNLSAGFYTIMVQDAEGCMEMDTVSILEPGPEQITLPDQYTITFGESVQLEPVTSVPLSDIDTIIWTPEEYMDCSDCFLPIVAPILTTEYYIEVVTIDGCVLNARTVVIVEKERDVYVPNVFSPNQDGQNDLFFINAKDGIVKNIEVFEIYNRWGTRVYAAENFLPNSDIYSWNGLLKGAEAQSGVYTWYAVIEFVDGESVLFEGDILLIR